MEMVMKNKKIKKSRVKKGMLLLVGLLSIASVVHSFTVKLKPNLRLLANQNVVMITDDPISGGGTGFYVKAPSGKTYLITNNHVCEAGKRMSLVIRHHNGKVTEFKPIIGDESKDLCLLETTDQTKGLTVATHMEKYTKYHLFGNPKLFKWVHEEGEIFDTDNVPLIHHVIRDISKPECDKPYMSISKMDFIFFELDVCMVNYKSNLSNIRAFGGNSGSPLLNEYGEVVGVLFAGNGETQYGFFIPLETLQEFLKGY
jgi:hypothetical protein